MSLWIISFVYSCLSFVISGMALPLSILCGSSKVFCSSTVVHFFHLVSDVSIRIFSFSAWFLHRSGSRSSRGWSVTEIWDRGNPGQNLSFNIIGV